MGIEMNTATKCYASLLTGFKDWLAKETDFEAVFISDVFPMEMHITPRVELQPSLFDEDGEVRDGLIRIVFSSTTSVEIALGFKIRKDILKKLLSKSEKIKDAYLLAFKEQMQYSAIRYGMNERMQDVLDDLQSGNPTGL